MVDMTNITNTFDKEYIQEAIVNSHCSGRFSDFGYIVSACWLLEPILIIWFDLDEAMDKW